MIRGFTLFKKITIPLFYNNPYKQERTAILEMEINHKTILETPERLFLRYALPCTFLLIVQKKIPQETANLLEEIYIKNKPLERKVLEEIFTTAYEQIKIIAKDKDPWNNETIKKYFLEKHNDFVDHRDEIPEGLKDFCRIQEAQIIDMHSNYEVTVMFHSHKTRIVKTKLVENTNIGNLVRVHYYYIVDKL